MPNPTSAGPDLELEASKLPAFPPLPLSAVKDQAGRPLFDAFQMHQYAARYVADVVKVIDQVTHAPGLPPLDAADLCTIVGVKCDGTEVTLGQGPLPPLSKARDILRSYDFVRFDDEHSQDSYALVAVEELVAWMVKVGWKAPPLVTIPAVPQPELTTPTGPFPA